MKLYFVRHGETAYNRARKIQGSLDIPLNETGISQAEAAKEHLQDIVFDGIYASPLKRAHKTAEILVGQGLTLDERLVERHYGDYEGQEIDKFRLEHPDYRKMGYTVDEYSVAGIEPLGKIKARLHSFLEEVKHRHQDGNVLVVAHGGVGVVLSAMLHQLEEEDILKLRIQNCQVMEFVL